MSAPARSTSTEPQILTRADGATIAYRRIDGAMPGIIFCGGYRSDMTGVKALFLEDYCRSSGRAYVRFDYFGHGQSSGDFVHGTIARWRDDSLAVLDSVTEGPQILIGSSMGGWIVLLAALARPQRIAALVGIAAAPDFTEDLLPSRLSPEQRCQIEEQGVVTLPSDYDPAGYVYTRALIEDARAHLLLRAPIAISAPVRLLHGLADASVPWQTSLRIAESLTGTDVTLTLVKDGDHRLSTDGDLKSLARTLDALVA
jgi:pimeloyl-ACP methyl ester carboxylesterase